MQEVKSERTPEWAAGVPSLPIHLTFGEPLQSSRHGSRL